MTADALEPLELLYESEGLPTIELPEPLRRLHGGDLGLPEPCLYANFVATTDGVVAIPGMPRSNDFVAGDSDADRFLMGLLRAFADAVLVGAGVLRASTRGTWRAESIYPRAADEYAELRQTLGLPVKPEVAVLTGHGSIDARHPLFESGALVLTSERHLERLRETLPAATTVLGLGAEERIDAASIVEALGARGHRRILCEAGPHTFGHLLAARLVDELFLTSSPLLVGDAGPGSRLGLVEDADLTPEGVRLRLLSVRRHGAYVFQRYAVV